MSTQIGKIGRIPVAFGLSWVQLQVVEGESPKEQIKSTLERSQLSYGCLFNPPATDLMLLCYPDAEHQKESAKALPAAIWLTQLGTYCLVIKELSPNVFWVGGIKDGLVDIRLDKILDAEALDHQVTEIAHSEHDDGTWGQYQLFVDVEQDLGFDWFAGAQRFSFNAMDLGKAPKQRIKKLRGHSDSLIPGAIAACFLAVIGYFGWQFWEKYQIKLRQQAELERAQEMAATDQRMGSLTEVRIAEAVEQALAQDLATPPVPVIVQACLNELNRQGTIRAGWRLTELVCDANQVSFTYRRDSNSYANWEDLHESFSGDDCLVERINQSEGQCKRPLSFVELRTPPARDHLLTVSRFLDQLPSRLQSKEGVAGFSGGIKQPALRPIQYIDPRKEASGAPDTEALSPVPIPQGYQQGSWQIKGRYLGMLDHVDLNAPYLNFKQLKFTTTGVATVTWDLTGAYFVRGDSS